MHHRLPGSLHRGSLKLHGLGVLVGLLISLGVPPEARAETVDMAVQSDEPAEYRARIDDALREFSVQNYEEARSLFLQAHAIMPNARTLRALGLCEFELRNYAESIRYLEGALASKVKPLTPALRKEGEHMITRARNFVGRVELEMRPERAQLLVDGVKVDGREALWLPMGEHTLEVSAPGFVSEKRKLNVKGGEDKRMSVILAASEQGGSETDSGSGKSSEKRWYKSPWLWGSLGVIVAGAGAATAIVLTRDNGSNPDRGSTGTLLPTN